MSHKPVIVICSSADFYRQAVDAQAALEPRGFKVVIPETAEKMKLSGDFDASHYRTWLSDSDDYHVKTRLMHTHFDEVAKADAILVINETKHGRAGYIGANVLMEMALAFHLRLPIFVMNPFDRESPFTEELLGMDTTLLNGDLKKLTL